jgi:acyl-CoA thioesterase FadM
MERLPAAGERVERQLLWQEGAIVPTPLRLYSKRVPESWIDYHGHLSEAFYLMVFSDAIDPLFDYIGTGAEYRARGASFFSVAWRLDFVDQVRLGDEITVSTRLLDADAKRMHLALAMERDARVVARAEQLMVHVDLAAGRAVPMPDRVARCLAAVKAAHDPLPRTGTEGSGLSISRTPGKADRVRL